jgi:hypothetical protein
MKKKWITSSQKITTTVIATIITNVSYAACEKGHDYYQYQIESGHGTVLDARTGLEWQICPVGQQWIDGLTPCKGDARKHQWAEVSNNLFDTSTITLLRNGWRVPTKLEIDQLMNQGCTFPSVSPLLMQTQDALYWSVSDLPQSNQAWASNFNNGKIILGDKKHRIGVRLVRNHTLLSLLTLSERELFVDELKKIGGISTKNNLDFSKIPGNNYAEKAGYLVARHNKIENYTKYELMPNEKQSWQKTFSIFLNDFLKKWTKIDYALSEVNPPPLPSPITLRQDIWETDAEFTDRVKLQQAKRQNEVEKIQANYRQQVEQNNLLIDDMQSVQRKRMDLANNKSFQLGVIRYASSQMMPILNIGTANLDRVTNKLFIKAQTPNGGDVGQYMINQPSPSIRKTILLQPKNIKLTPEISLSPDGHLVINHVRFQSQEFIGVAQAVDTDHIDGSVNKVAYIDVVNFNKDSDIASLKKQNPNLLDKYEIGSITFKDGFQSSVRFNDDLGPLINRAKVAHENPSIWLFVIGAEKYKATDNIAFARRSAEAFTEATSKSLGIPKGHIFTLYDQDATSNSIKGRLKQLLTQGIKKGDTVIFYYNGHGVPIPSDGNMAYLMPTDTIPDFVSDDGFFRLDNIYKIFQESAAGKVLMVLDSCFTGQTDGKSIFKGDKAAARLSPKRLTIDENKLAVLTAGTDTQYSSAYYEKGHRLFSYFLIKELLNQPKSIEELYKSVAKNVRDQSRKNGIQGWQDPQLNGGSGRSQLSFN